MSIVAKLLRLLALSTTADHKQRHAAESVVLSALAQIKDDPTLTTVVWLERQLGSLVALARTTLIQEGDDNAAMLVVYLRGYVAAWKQLSPKEQRESFGDGRFLQSVLVPLVRISLRLHSVTLQLVVLEGLPSLFRSWQRSNVTWPWRDTLKAWLADLRVVMDTATDLEHTKTLLGCSLAFVAAHPLAISSYSIVRLAVLPAFTLACEHNELVEPYSHLVRLVHLQLSSRMTERVLPETQLAVTVIHGFLGLLQEINLTQAQFKVTTAWTRWIDKHILDEKGTGSRPLQHLLLPFLSVWLCKKSATNDATIGALLRTCYEKARDSRLAQVEHAISDWTKAQLAEENQQPPPLSLVVCAARVAAVLSDRDPHISVRLMQLAIAASADTVVAVVADALAQRSLAIDSYSSKADVVVRHDYEDLTNSGIGGKREHASSCSAESASNLLLPSPYRFLLTMLDLTTQNPTPEPSRSNELRLFRLWTAGITRHLMHCPLLEREDHVQRVVLSLHKRLREQTVRARHLTVSCFHGVCLQLSQINQMSTVLTLLDEILHDQDSSVCDAGLALCTAIHLSTDVHDGFREAASDLLSQKSKRFVLVQLPSRVLGEDTVQDITLSFLHLLQIRLPREPVVERLDPLISLERTLSNSLIRHHPKIADLVRDRPAEVLEYVNRSNTVVEADDLHASLQALTKVFEGVEALMQAPMTAQEALTVLQDQLVLRRRAMMSPKIVAKPTAATEPPQIVADLLRILSKPLDDQSTHELDRLLVTLQLDGGDFSDDDV